MIPGHALSPTVAHLPPNPATPPRIYHNNHPKPPSLPPPPHHPDVPDHDTSSTPEVRESVLADILHQLDLERSARAELEEQLRTARGIKKVGSEEDIKSKEELLSLIDGIEGFQVDEDTANPHVSDSDDKFSQTPINARPWEEPDLAVESRVVQWSTYDALFKKWTSRPPKDVKRGKGGNGDCTLEDLDEGDGGTFALDDVEAGEGREWVGQWEVDKGRYGSCKDGRVEATLLSVLR